MENKSLLEKLIDNTPLAIIVIGLILFLLGANGGWSKADLKIDSTGWRVALALMGLVVFSVGGLFFWRGKTRIGLDDELNKNYGIKINVPDEGAQADNPIEVSGTYEIKPKDHLIRAIEFDPLSQQYWPKGYLTFDEKKKKWYAEVYIGGALGAKRTIIIAAIGSNGRVLLDYSKKVNKEIAPKWPGLEALTSDIVVYDRVTVRRADDAVKRG